MRTIKETRWCAASKKQPPPRVSINTLTLKTKETCITPMLNKLLKIQLLIQKKVEGIVFDNDAKGCYDRITIGMYGSGLFETDWIFKELSSHGLGQGGCASPILWALLSQLLLTALGEKFDCTRVVSVDGEEEHVQEHVQPGNSLVDDTTMGVTTDDTKMDQVPVEVIGHHGLAIYMRANNGVGPTSPSSIPGRRGITNYGLNVRTN
jgi:hypothetical protein